MAFYLELHKISPYGNEEIPGSLHKNIVSQKVSLDKRLSARNQGTNCVTCAVANIYTVLSDYQLARFIVILASL